jgi:hypothetical protein
MSVLCRYATSRTWLDMKQISAARPFVGGGRPQRNAHALLFVKMRVLVQRHSNAGSPK